MTVKKNIVNRMGADGMGIIDGEGQQGDVEICRLDDKYLKKLKKTNTIQTNHDGSQVTLAYGEVTGHHHTVFSDMDGLTMERPMPDLTANMSEADLDKLVSKKSAKEMIEKAYTPACQLFADKELTEMLVKDGEFLRTDLNIGYLLVNAENGVVLRHQEHDPIRIAKGLYYIGNQVESQGLEEHRVAD